MSIARDRVRQKEWYPMPWDDTRRTMLTETAEACYKMQQEKSRRTIDAKRLRTSSYRVYFYGTPEELHNKKYGTGKAKVQAIEIITYYIEKIINYQNEELVRFQKDLQTQLLYNESQKQHFYTMTEEGERLAKELQKEKMKEKKEEDHKKAFMRKNYRDSNKMLIELKAEKRKADLLQTKSEEKELLKHNPINWSKTLS